MIPALYHSQWPSPRVQPILAKYIAHNHVPTINTLQLVDKCAYGLQLSVSNGMSSIVGTQIIVEHAMLACSKTTIEPQHLIQFALQLLWLLYSTNPASMASYILHKQMQAPCHFWNAVADEILFLFMPPAKLVPAFYIGRPDIQTFVMAAYLRWVTTAQNGGLVCAVATLLSQTAFDFDSVSAVWALTKTCMLEDGIVVAANKVLAPNAAYVSNAAKCNILLDGNPTFAISVRDKLLLAMRYMWDPRFAWSSKGCPANAPKVFHTIAKTHAYLFGHPHTSNTSILAIISHSE